MATTATFQADFSRWNESLRNAQAGLKSFEVPVRGVQQQLQRMSNAFLGVEIKKQADLAVAALKPIGGVTKLTEQEQRKLNATVTEAIAKYDALGQEAPADLRKIQKELQQTEKTTGFLSGALAKVGAAFAAAFTIGAIKTAITDTIAYAGTITDLSAKTGFGVRALQELKFAADQNGSSLEAVTNAAFDLQKRIGSGGDGVTGALKKLGLNLGEVKNLRPEEQFTLVASKLGEVRNQSDRAAVGAALMGKGFRDVSPLIVAGIEAQIQKAREYGVVLDEDTIASLEELGDAWEAVKLAGTAFIAKALVPLAPVITQTLQALVPFAAKIAELPAFFNKAHVAILKFADAQTQATIKLLEISKVVNPVSNAFGQVDARIGELRVQSFFLRNEMELVGRGFTSVGEAAAQAAGTSGGGGIAELDKAVGSLRDKLSGAALKKELKELEQAWKALTPAQRQNEEVIKRTLVAYEKIRQELPRVGGALEDLRTAHLKAIEPAAMHDLLWGRLARTTMPEATRMFQAGQSALDGLARSGALLSSRLVPIEVQMKSIPKEIKAMSVASKDAELRQKEAAAAALAWRQGLEDVAQAFATLAQVAPGAMGVVASWLGRVTASLNLFVKGVDGIGKGMEAFKKGDILAGISSITSGILGVASAVLSLGKAIVDALFKSRTEKTMERVAYEFGVSISEGLAQGIEDAAKEQFGGNRQASKIFHLDQIISEGGGLNSQNFQQLFARFRDLFSMVETGAFSAAEGIEVLDKNFKSFADFVTKGGSLASRELLDIINLTEQFGLKSAEVSAFVVQETDKALKGLSTFLSNAGVKTQQAADGISAALFGIFEAQTRNGVPAAEVIKQLDPLIQKLDEQLKAAGLSGGATFDEIKSLAAVASHEIAGPLISGVLGLEQALAGLHNSGVLTEDMFDGLTATVADTYQQILATGVDGAKALQLISPSLQTIWELQKDFNYTVDEATQALLDEAEAAGTVGEAHRTAQEQMLRMMERQTFALEGIARLFGVDIPEAISQTEQAVTDMTDTITDEAVASGKWIENAYTDCWGPPLGELEIMQGAVEDLHREILKLPKDIDIEGRVRWDIPEMPNPDGIEMPHERSEEGVPGYRTGTPGLGFLDFGHDGRRVELHGREAVVPEDRIGEFLAKHGGGVSVQVSGLVIHASGKREGEEAGEAFLQYIEKNTRGAQSRLRAVVR